MTQVSEATRTFVRNGLPLLTRSSENPHAAVGKWILGTGGLVVGMIHVGGITRLTQSGLSMTSWSPLGSLPPITTTQWQDEFQRYKSFPEWQQRKSMTMKEFQFIYAWEYGHRMLGRFVGVAFCLPWAYFSFRGMIPAGYQPRMALLASMGGAQGLVGWWMVKSGLGEDRRGDKQEIRVRPQRLAAHLGMAVATYGALTWTGLGILSLPHERTNAALSQLQQLAKSSPGVFQKALFLRTGTMLLTGITGLTIVSGALVAGNDAGRAFNTWPDMDGEWIPGGMSDLSPNYRNWIENTTAVQFNHRVLATVTACSAVSLAAVGLFSARTTLLTPQIRYGMYALALSATGQFTLGVTALISFVPLHLAAAHQVGSIVLLTSELYLLHALRFARPALLALAKK